MPNICSSRARETGPVRPGPTKRSNWLQVRAAAARTAADTMTPPTWYNEKRLRGSGSTQERSKQVTSAARRTEERVSPTPATPASAVRTAQRGRPRRRRGQARRGAPRGAVRDRANRQQRRARWRALAGGKRISRDRWADAQGHSRDTQASPAGAPGAALTTLEDPNRERGGPRSPADGCP